MPVVPRRLLTVADLAVLPRRLPSGDVWFELDDGVPVAQPLATHEHGRIHAGLLSCLADAGRMGLGTARGRVGVIL